MSRGASVVVPGAAAPDDETAVMTCPYCNRSFRRERLRDLHVGGAREDLSDGEAAAYKAAVEAEAGDLLVYHLKVADAPGVVFAVLFLPAVAGLSL